MIAIHKQKMINELIQIINSWNEYSEQIYGFTKKDAKIFLQRLQVGIYNSILKSSYWFASLPTTSSLVKIEKEKNKLQSYTNITEENYLVYSIIQEIKEYIDYLSNWQKVYQKPFITVNGDEQSPLTFKELAEFSNLYNEVLHKNYTWQEARYINEEIEKLNIKENKDFPHIIDELESIFNPHLNPEYKKYKQEVKYSNNILKLNKVTNKLIEYLTEKNLHKFLEDKKECPYEEYIRDMIIYTKPRNMKEVKNLLNTLLTPKKLLELSSKKVPQPYLTTIRKHYNYIFSYSNDLEFLEESTKILNTIIEINKDKENSLYEITATYNMILISFGIIPIPLNEKIINLEEHELRKQVIKKTIKLAHDLNK